MSNPKATVSTNRKRKHIDTGVDGNSGTEEEENHKGLLGSLLTTEIGSGVLPFLGFPDLVSLRVADAPLRSVSDRELFSRSIAGLPASVDRRDRGFHCSVAARTGWSPKHAHRNAVVRSALDVANRFGQNGSVRYEEGTALELLEAGQRVSMEKFGAVENQDDDDNDEVYLHWSVSAPTFHKQIEGSAAWSLFRNHHYLPVEWFEDLVAVSRVFFGLLINASSVRLNSFKSFWATSGATGEDLKSVLLIETTDKQTFEIEMDRAIMDQ